VETVTEDLSSDGFYCLSKFRPAPGDLVACTLEVPVHSPNRTQHMVPLDCRVRVVRVEGPNADGLFGLGCRIEDYRFPHTGNGKNG